MNKRQLRKLLKQLSRNPWQIETNRILNEALSRNTMDTEGLVPVDGGKYINEYTGLMRFLEDRICEAFGIPELKP